MEGDQGMRTMKRHDQHLLPTEDNHSGSLFKGKHSINEALTCSSSQSTSKMSPVDVLCSDIGMDPAKFLTDDVKGKHGARRLEHQNFGVSNWRGGWVFRKFGRISKINALS